MSWALILAAAATTTLPETGEESAIERLAIHDIVEAEGLDAEGTRIAILSEIVDTEHVLLAGSNIRQWRQPLTGEGVSEELVSAHPLLFPEEWHGTHIAGIIASDCDAGELRGVACSAAVDVYDFGSYGDFPFFDRDANLGVDPEAAFLRRFLGALDSITAQGIPVANLSFNVEAPHVALVAPEGERPVIGDLLRRTGVPFEELYAALPQLVAEGLIEPQDPADLDEIEAIAGPHDDRPALVYAMLLPISREWDQLGQAIASYQAAGGVVVISEANNRLNGRSGVLNSMPSLHPAVSADQWLSVVHVEADGEGGFRAPLNACGEMAANYCLSVEAGMILSADLPDASGANLRAASGHSMATPMVSGLLALVAELARRDDPDFAMRDAMYMLRCTADRDFPGYDPAIHGVGLLNARRALAAAGPSVGQRVPSSSCAP